MLIGTTRGDRQGERGHLIVGLVVLMAVMLIMLTAASQSWTFLLRRDREAELIRRGEEYARAIEFYRKENNIYPLRLELLADRGPHGHRYIRRLWEDPVAKDGEWGLLYLSPTGKGFINPYATQVTDPFLADGVSPVDTGFGSKRKKPGYSEITPRDYERLEGMNLPIVGVVHKKEEEGLKIYKFQSNLNDWAFTILAEGEEHNRGAGSIAKPRRGKQREMGIGNPTQPMFLPRMLDSPEIPPTPRELQQEAYQKWLKEQAEEDPNTDPNAVEEDPNAIHDEDPNAVDDEDPNAVHDDDPNDEAPDDDDPNGDTGTDAGNDE